MKKAFNITNGDWLILEVDTGETYQVNLNELKDDLQSTIDGLPEDISNDDDKLLAWAKVYYNASQEYEAIKMLERKIADIQEIIDLIENT